MTKDPSNLPAPWVRRTHPNVVRVQSVLVGAAVASLYALPVWGVVCLGAIFLGRALPFWGVAEVLFLGGVLGGQSLFYGLDYHFIRCPACRHNPTRTKKGGYLTIGKMTARLVKMTSCPACGYDGR